VVEIGPGDVVYFAPAEKHWHGAAPDTFMVHIAINPATNSLKTASYGEELVLSTGSLLHLADQGGYLL
jgi:quercetin dioxygenase-like cupin family protein